MGVARQPRHVFLDHVVQSVPLVGHGPEFGRRVVPVPLQRLEAAHRRRLRDARTPPPQQHLRRRAVRRPRQALEIKVVRMGNTMARTRHKILVAVAAITKRLRPEPELARGQDDGAAVGAHRSLLSLVAGGCGVDDPSSRARAAQHTPLASVDDDGPWAVTVAALASWSWPFEAPCCRRAVGSAKMGCRLRPEAVLA